MQGGGASALAGRGFPLLKAAAIGQTVRMAYFRFLKDNAAWLGVGFLLAFTSSYGQTFFISIFAAEIMAEYGLTNGGWGAIYTAGTTASALVMFWAGGLADRFRVRVLAPVVFAALAASSLAMAANAWLILLPAIVFALRFTGQGMCNQLAVVAMARWFSASRGRALAISSLGFAMGTAFLPLLFVQAKAVVDWRTLWVVAAGMALIAILPVILLLRHERQPQDVTRAVIAPGMGGRHWTRTEMFHHPLFWLLVPAIFGPAAFNTALFFHQVHLSQIKGWTHAEFVALLPLFTVVAVAATFASGWAIDRFGARWLMVGQTAPIAAGFAILWGFTGLGAGALSIALVGVSSGLMATLPGSFAAEFYGTRHIGSVKAVWVALMVFGSAVGPGLTGWLIDAGFAFDTQSLAIAVFFAGSVILSALGVAGAGPVTRPSPA